MSIFMGISPGGRMHPGREHRAEKSDSLYSMLKFFVLDDSLREVVAVSSAPAPEGAFASSFLGGPPGQLP
jgi:hypothetical protein